MDFLSPRDVMEVRVRNGFPIGMPASLFSRGLMTRPRLDTRIRGGMSMSVALQRWRILLPLFPIDMMFLSFFFLRIEFLFSFLGFRLGFTPTSSSSSCSISIEPPPIWKSYFVDLRRVIPSRAWLLFEALAGFEDDGVLLETIFFRLWIARGFVSMIEAEDDVG